jgi:hypothetical protein
MALWDESRGDGLKPKLFWDITPLPPAKREPLCRVFRGQCRQSDRATTGSVSAGRPSHLARNVRCLNLHPAKFELCFVLGFNNGSDPALKTSKPPNKRRWSELGRRRQSATSFITTSTASPEGKYLEAEESGRISCSKLHRERGRLRISLG